MGMFDYFCIEDYSVHEELQKVQPTDVEVEHNKDLQWQTKSLNCMMDTYTLLKDGRLMRKGSAMDGWSYDPVETVEEVYPYHGFIEIHDSRVLAWKSPFKPSKTRWISVTLKMTSGVLEDVRINEDKIYDR